jgi:hypothetical protein
MARNVWFCDCMAFLDNLINCYQRTQYHGVVLRVWKEVHGLTPSLSTFSSYASAFSALPFVFLQPSSHSDYTVVVKTFILYNVCLRLVVV